MSKTLPTELPPYGKNLQLRKLVFDLVIKTPVWKKWEAVTILGTIKVEWNEKHAKPFNFECVIVDYLDETKGKGYLTKQEAFDAASAWYWSRIESAFKSKVVPFKKKGSNV